MARWLVLRDARVHICCGWLLGGVGWCWVVLVLGCVALGRRIERRAPKTDARQEAGLGLGWAELWLSVLCCAWAAHRAQSAQDRRQTGGWARAGLGLRCAWAAHGAQSAQDRRMLSIVKEPFACCSKTRSLSRPHSCPPLQSVLWRPCGVHWRF